MIEQVAFATHAGDTLKNLAVCHRVAVSGDLDGIRLLMLVPPIAHAQDLVPTKANEDKQARRAARVESK